MTWKYKDKTCACGANLEDLTPIRPRLFVTETMSVADCPACPRTPEIVEEGEPEPETEPEPEPETETEPESEAESEAETEPAEPVE